MSKLRNLLPTIFGGKEAQNPTPVEGRLEKDAAPVDDNEPDNNNSGAMALPSTAGTPTASSDLTESVLRELSDPNYNSMDVVHSANIPGTLSNVQTNNTMNVHSAQQQVVMNFSNANNLHFGSVYNFNQNLSACSSRKGSTSTAEESVASPDGKPRASATRKTVSIVAMMQSQEEPDVRLLDVVSTHLGEGWKQVMRDLGMSEGQIDQAIIDHQMHGNIREVRPLKFKLLLFVVECWFKNRTYKLKLVCKTTDYAKMIVTHQTNLMTQIPLFLLDFIA